MPLNIKKIKTKSNAPEIKAGSYMGRVVQVIGLGTQSNTTQEGEVKEIDQVMITVEFPTLRMKIGEDDKPRWLNKRYKVSMHEASSMVKQLVPLLENIDKDDLRDLINVPVMCTIGKTKTGNPKIVAIGAAIDGVEVGELENETSAFDFDDPNFDEFLKLRKWQQALIMEAVNYDGSSLQQLIDVDGFELSQD